ncbi:MAG: hypothetical protein HY877_04645 [Deltaproteobacteria bacterium]|nr:hypothetical protein [Deltaproteobacteria bacterium]
MVVTEPVSFSQYFIDAVSLASGFENVAVDNVGVADVLGVLENSESSDRTFLFTNTALETLLPAYKQAAADGNRDRMQRLGSLIALNIREHASTFNRLLAASSPRANGTGVTGKRFGSAEDAVAALGPHAAGEATPVRPAERAAEIPATMAMVSAAEYLRGLEGEEIPPWITTVPSLPEMLAVFAGLPFTAVGVFGFFLANGLVKMSLQSIAETYTLLTLGIIFLGYGGYKSLTLHNLRQYVRRPPPALYDRKTGEVMAPTLARFKQGAVPLYPVDKEYDVEILPVGSHVLLKDVRVSVLNATNADYPNFVFFQIKFPATEAEFALFGIYQAKTGEEAEAAKRTFQQGPVTFVGTLHKDKSGSPEIKVVRILEESNSD